MCVYLSVLPGRLCAHWSRTMQPGNRGWPPSWSRWWPLCVLRAEDRISQGALGRDPIRNRAVPEWRPVPNFFFFFNFHHFRFLPFFCLSKIDLVSWPFDLLPLPWERFCFLIQSAAHRLVLPEYIRGVVSGWGQHLPQCNVRESSASPQGERFKGWLCQSWPYWHESVPLLERRRRKHFYVAFKNLHQYVILKKKKAPTVLGVVFVELFFSFNLWQL